MNALPPKRGRHLVKAGSRFATGGGTFAHLWAGSFHRILDRIDAGLEQGMLEAWLPDGGFRMLGGRAPGPACEVRLRSWRALVRLATSGSAGWYRAWSVGEWGSPDPVAVFELFMANAKSLGGVARASGPARWVGWAVHAFRRNSRKGSRRNIAFHYDLGNDFYQLWLDEKMHYSSALYVDPEDRSEPLEVAQQRKANAVLARLDLKDGDSLLEIGCGWGALAEVALSRMNLRYDGLTLSAEQRNYAQKRLAPLSPRGDAQILLTDYRDISGQYDAIASVEMVEAVGQGYWRSYLAAIRGLLKPGGRAALQFITIDDAIFDRYAANTDFIQAYIFPGGLLMSESRFRKLAAAEGLQWTDPHHFGLHYAETLRRWRERFDEVVLAGKLPASFDESFVKLWRYYLMYCEGGFRGGGINVMQVTLVKGV
ncbi:class I SAM-dependent methyltransferase [Sphingobium phenoxybenzoativorans]|uniref:Class I SAM-dependent methyltransferase n=1 Tax=Sphingobium phenoxybenzoativorans TaxID=1592790 RepID=A0A975Q3D3_9SPHN|nr:cyclopropane-fatty-acyl-phospholipid synthase family protein [Sphingobium phenoxybenzoativorans]QUT07407.1 class I SAM-dependent methyltransferase [Sphingobium phenoxybenzoativorans]